MIIVKSEQKWLLLFLHEKPEKIYEICIKLVMRCWIKTVFIKIENCFERWKQQTNICCHKNPRDNGVAEEFDTNRIPLLSMIRESSHPWYSTVVVEIGEVSSLVDKENQNKSVLITRTSVYSHSFLSF